MGWLKERSAGVMLHVSCLPSRQGIGCFDQNARDFIDFLAKSGAQYWQICPLSPTGYGDSPYQGLSSFAINPYFIDFDAAGIADLPKSTADDHVDFGSFYSWFNDVLPEVGPRLSKTLEKDSNFIDFKKQQSCWLPAYALFAALKRFFSELPWYQWPQKFRIYKKVNFNQLPEPVVQFYQWYMALQHIAHMQWQKIKRYAHKKNVQIIGDLPMFPGCDSADVWSNSDIFQLDSELQPINVAGVPPDYFSPEGQLWGNPVYNWEILAQNKYKWWQERITRNVELFDVIRLDHFRGFDRFWSLPAKNTNAINGQWSKGPGRELFSHVSCKKFIAEDLGDIDISAKKLKETLSFPGMYVLQFAFSGDPKNIYLPHHHNKEGILYIGTHDNDTLQGWYRKTDEGTRDQVRRYFGIEDQQISWKFLTEAYRSPCLLAIMCAQDLLNLGSEARFNTPGVADGNWQWRLTQEQLLYLRDHIFSDLHEYKIVYNR